MPPLRVALDYRPALLSCAGIGRATRELALGLQAVAGLDLRLFGHCLARCRVATLAHGLHRLPIPGRLQLCLARLGLDAGRLSGNPEVFHWTDTVHPPVRRARIVLTIHDVAFADPQWHGAAAAGLLRRAKAALAQADAVVAPSQATARALEQLGIDSRQVRVIPFGADHVPARRQCGDAQPLVLAIGTIEPRKNHRRLLRAWLSLQPRPQLVVLGRAGWLCDDVCRELQERHRRGELIWRQNVPDLQVFEYLHRATVLVYPSLLEGFGFPSLEALAAGVPVVAGDTPALREVLGSAAVFCDPTDHDAIAQALTRVLADQTLRTTMIEEGLLRAAQFTWSACAAQHAALYRELAHG